MGKISESEKRQHPRIDAKIKVSFKTMGDFIEEYTKNISKGGIFLKTDKLLDPNAQIELQLMFPDSKREHKIIGRVKRLVVMSDPDSEEKQIYGVGIHFVKLENYTLDAIEELYNRYKSKAKSK